MTVNPDPPALPPAFAAIQEEFLALSVADRLLLLLEFSNGLPEVPERFAGHPELMEPVPECQSPIAFVIELEPATGSNSTGPNSTGSRPDGDALVHFYASAPPGAPTSRGFAGILAEGLTGLTAAEVAAIPLDYPLSLGLAEAVSPLRLRGMTALLTRAKRQVAELTA